MQLPSSSAAFQHPTSNLMLNAARCFSGHQPQNCARESDRMLLASITTTRNKCLPTEVSVGSPRDVWLVLFGNIFETAVEITEYDRRPPFVEYEPKLQKAFSEDLLAWKGRSGKRDRRLQKGMPPTSPGPSVRLVPLVSDTSLSPRGWR